MAGLLLEFDIHEIIFGPFSARPPDERELKSFWFTTLDRNLDRHLYRAQFKRQRDLDIIHLWARKQADPNVPEEERERCKFGIDRGTILKIIVSVDSGIRDIPSAEIPKVVISLSEKQMRSRCTSYRTHMLQHLLMRRLLKIYAVEELDQNERNREDREITDFTLLNSMVKKIFQITLVSAGSDKSIFRLGQRTGFSFGGREQPTVSGPTEAQPRYKIGVAKPLFPEIRIEKVLEKGNPRFAKPEFFRKEPLWADFAKGRISKRKETTGIVSYLKKKRYPLVLRGDPGAGKSVIARHVGYLLSKDKWDVFMIQLKRDRLDKYERMIRDMPRTLIIIDDAHLDLPACERFVRAFLSRQLLQTRLLISTRRYEEGGRAIGGYTQLERLEQKKIAPTDAWEAVIRNFFAKKHGVKPRISEVGTKNNSFCPAKR